MNKAQLLLKLRILEQKLDRSLMDLAGDANIEGHEEWIKTMGKALVETEKWLNGLRDESGK